MAARLAIRRTQAVADGEIVWSRHPDAGVKFVGSKRFSGMTVARKPGRRGERDISRKTIAQGRPDALRWTCMLVRALLCTLRTGPRVQRAPGFPCALCLERAGVKDKTRAQCAARSRRRVTLYDASHLYSSSPGLTGRSSNPETPAIEPRSRGVLDRPAFAGDDDLRMCVRILAARCAQSFCWKPCPRN